jgi:cytochrome P450 family 144
VIFGAELVDDPYPFYDWLRQIAPVWRVPGTDAFLVTSWVLVTEAAGRVEDFSNHFRHTLFSQDDGRVGVIDKGEGGASDVFAGADPPDHTEHRRVFFPELVQARMERLEPDMAAFASGLLDKLLTRRSADAASQLADVLPLQIMAERVIGFRAAEIAQMQRWVFGGARFMGGRLRLDELAAVGDEVAGMWPWVAEQLDERLAEPSALSSGGDVLGAAAAGVRDGALTADEAAFTLMVLLGAGAETTTSFIGKAVRILAERPQLQEQLRAEPDLVSAFIEEVLRFESPFRFHPRTAGAGRARRRGDSRPGDGRVAVGSGEPGPVGVRTARRVRARSNERAPARRVRPRHSLLCRRAIGSARVADRAQDAARTDPTIRARPRRPAALGR